MKPECISIECIYNDKLHKGLCIGVSQHTNSYSKDVIRMCWVNQKPTPDMRCLAKMQAQMTPKEAVGVGVGLIRSSIVGENLLRRMELEATRVKEEKTNEG